jgi:DNA-binding NtrC family response regulator
VTRPVPPAPPASAPGGEPVRVLVVDDDAAVRYTLREILASEGLAVEEAADGAEALARWEAHPAPLVVTDLRMPGMDGMELLRRLVARTPAPRVVVITAHGSERQAVEAMKAGAADYFKKPFENEELLAVVRRTLEAVRLAHENERLAGELTLARTMVFASEAMRRLAVLVARVAPRDVNVLVTGESGTGKERVAEAIVQASRRADRSFVRFNCAALTPELAEAELFGHARGAFTGAVRARPGLFGEADGGTLLLDEVGELAANTQAKLLRVLQEGEVRAVGEERSRTVDVRVIAATHRDLAAEVRAGRFREDLFYRLDVVHLHVPPLRERPGDVPVLARHFLARFAERYGLASASAPDAVLHHLAGQAWPGNVRELENAVERLVALSPAEGLDLSLLPGAGPAEDRGPLPLRERVQAYERGLVVEALRAAGGNRSEAARRLGVSRVTLHDKLRRYGLGGPGGDDEG